MIAEICTKPAVTASPDTTSAQEAAQRMRSRKVGSESGGLASTLAGELGRART